MSHPAAIMLGIVRGVAEARARREGRPMAVERSSVVWTVRPESEPTPADFERVACVSQLGEFAMGAAKKLYTARGQGDSVPKSLRDAFTPGRPEPEPRPEAPPTPASESRAEPELGEPPGPGPGMLF